MKGGVFMDNAHLIVFLIWEDGMVSFSFRNLYYNLFTSDSDFLLWFDFLNHMCAWDSQAHKYGCGLFLFFFLPLENKVNSQIWPGCRV